MSSQPPGESPEPATKQDLAGLEERLEVHLAVFVDERITGAERRIIAALAAELATQSRAVATAVVGGAVAAAVVAIAVGHLV